MTSPVADKSSADGLAAFPGEVPLQSQLKQWIEDFQSTHSGAYSAAFAGMEPMFMIDFNPFPMTSIPPLILDAANGVTAQMVQKRDDTILEKTFHNQQQSLTLVPDKFWAIRKPLQMPIDDRWLVAGRRLMAHVKALIKASSLST